MAVNPAAPAEGSVATIEAPAESGDFLSRLPEDIREHFADTVPESVERTDAQQSDAQDDAAVEAPASQDDEPTGDALESTDTTDDAQWSRRGIVQKAERDLSDAQQRIAELEAQIASGKTAEQIETERRETETRIAQELDEYIGTADEIAQLQATLLKPVETYDDQDAHNVAAGRLAEIQKQQRLLPPLHERMRASFSHGVYSVFDDVAKTYEGIDRAKFVDHLGEPGLQPDQVKERLRAAFDHLYQTGYEAGSKEYKGKYDAEKAANESSQRARGGNAASPERGGLPATPANIQGLVQKMREGTLSTEEYLQHRDQILAAVPSR